MTVASQQKVPILYQGRYLDCDLRYDMLVEESIIVKVKAVEVLLAIHEAQLLTYLKLLDKPKGMLLNINCVNIFKEGQRTLVTRRFVELPRGY